MFNNEEYAEKTVDNISNVIVVRLLQTVVKHYYIFIFFQLMN